MADQKDEKKKVKVKFLKNVGGYQAGQVAEIDQDEAEHVLKVSKIFNGERLVENRKAIAFDEAEKAEHNIDIATATQAEMTAAGLKNIIPSPGDTHPVAPHLSQEEFMKLSADSSRDELKNVEAAKLELKKKAIEDNKLRDQGKPVLGDADKDLKLHGQDDKDSKKEQKKK